MLINFGRFFILTLERVHQLKSSYLLGRDNLCVCFLAQSPPVKRPPTTQNLLQPPVQFLYEVIFIA